MPRFKIIVVHLLVPLAAIYLVAASAPAVQEAPVRQERPGQEQPAEGVESPPAVEPRPAADQPQYRDLTVTEHEMNGLRFRAVAGFQPLNDDEGQLRGNLFFIYYTRLDGDGEPLHRTSDRPVTYIFNGGPGAASVWLHLGTAGPYRVPMGDEGEQAPPPHVVRENPNTWLDVTDLCFIDPIGTGFSRAAGEAPDERMFYGVHQDRQWVGEFIRLHATRFMRWSDPKFLAGESYGTARAAQLASFMHSRYGMDMNGIILISAVLDFATIREAENNPLPFVLFMPTYTAVAHWHGKLPEDLEDYEDARREAEAFAIEEYLPAISRGNALDEDERQRIAEKYARLTGLPVDYVLMSDLRVGPHRFMKRLLNDDRRVVGRMDGRITGFDIDPIRERPDFDPSLTGYLGVYTGAFNEYVRNTLQFETDLPYEALSGRVGPWQAAPGTQRGYSGGYLDVSSDLRDAMVAVPEMKVLLASGFFDLATPYFAADYTIEQMRLPRELRENITTRYYGGGHMMYHVEAEQERLHRHVSEFIRASLGAAAQE